jgi:hypothetical protein
MSRNFNSSAYKAHDLDTKKMVIKIMEKTNKFKFYDKIDVELFKECDVRMTHIATGFVVRFENECRINFDELVNKYNTIHIPIRKKNTLADFYLVWNYELTQFIKIKRDVMKESMVVNVECSSTRNATHEYNEDFIDVPKLKCEWFVVGKEYNLIPLNWPE